MVLYENGPIRLNWTKILSAHPYTYTPYYSILFFCLTIFLLELSHLKGTFMGLSHGKDVVTLLALSLPDDASRVDNKKNYLCFVLFIRVNIVIIMCFNTSSRPKFPAEHTGIKIKVIHPIFTRVSARILHRTDSVG